MTRMGRNMREAHSRRLGNGRSSPSLALSVQSVSSVVLDYDLNPIRVAGIHLFRTRFRPGLSVDFRLVHRPGGRGCQ